MSGRKLMMLLSVEIGDYDELAKGVKGDYPEWSDYEIDAYLRDPETWRESSYDYYATELYSIEVKDI
jgi:hypothetical protein